MKRLNWLVMLKKTLIANLNILPSKLFSFYSDANSKRILTLTRIGQLFFALNVNFVGVISPNPKNGHQARAQ